MQSTLAAPGFIHNNASAWHIFGEGNGEFYTENKTVYVHGLNQCIALYKQHLLHCLYSGSSTQVGRHVDYTDLFLFP